MDKEHLRILEDDFSQSRFSRDSFIIRLKLIYYFFERPIANFFMKRKAGYFAGNDAVFGKFDLFLKNEGGMFKGYAYSLCNKMKPLKGATVLVPGGGYGRNFFQLAAYRPKKIVAFDLSGYKEEWDYLKRKIKDVFGTEVEFYKGDFDSIPSDYVGCFDWIISDAVLEHVKNLDAFLNSSNKFLKKDGFFYASFGPIWHGPGGDHIFVGKDNIFDHLIMPRPAYEERFKKMFSSIGNDSCEGSFLVRERLFSYLPASGYFSALSASGFKKIKAYAKISGESFSLFDRAPDIFRKLNEAQEPVFDRFCGGIYVWAEKE